MWVCPMTYPPGYHDVGHPVRGVDRHSVEEVSFGDMFPVLNGFKDFREGLLLSQTQEGVS